MDPIRVFHLEDYQIMRDGVKRLLHDDGGIKVVGEASTGKQLFDRIKWIDVDVVIMDLYLDGMEDLGQMNGFEICGILRQEYPDIKILAHSMYEDGDKIGRIIKAGALGFVSKKSGFDELLHGVKAVASNKFYICLDTAKRFNNFDDFVSGKDPRLISREEKFSKREREILDLLAFGKSSKQIGLQLLITERTVETHRKNMIRKAEVSNTVELIAYAIFTGLVKK